MKRMEVKKKKRRLVLLEILSFLVTTLPLGTVLVLKWGVYTVTPAATVKLCTGGIVALVLLLLKVIGKLKMPRRIVVYAMVFGMSYLFESVLNDLVLLSGMALLGELVDFLFFARSIKRLKEDIAIEKTADVTAKRMEQIIERQFSGRV